MQHGEHRAAKRGQPVALHLEQDDRARWTVQPVAVSPPSTPDGAAVGCLAAIDKRRRTRNVRDIRDNVLHACHIGRFGTVLREPLACALHPLPPMRRQMFGQTGRQVPVIGQGTWYIDSAGRAAAVDALRRGFDLGMTHIDTAEMYGEAEAIVGSALAGRRNDVFLVSKVLPENASRAGTIAACERSLRHLRTDRLDCYLLHWPGPHPLHETVDAFEALRRAGKILSWGVSNFDEADLRALWKTENGDQAVCNQVLYHLRQRAIEHAVLPWCEQHGLAVVAYSPFGHEGFPASRSRAGRVLQAVAEARGVTPRQVALAFLVRRPSVFTIPKAVAPGHVSDNAAAGALVLDDEEIERLDAAFPLGRRPRSLPMI